MRRTAAERAYRLLLRCYPAEFRDEYADEMLDTFRRRLDEDRRHGVAATASLWAQALSDSLFRAPGEHLDILRQDVRYATRSLRRAPLFSLTTIGTLAIAVGAITAIFSLVHAVALKPLPYDPEGRLVRIWETNAALDISGFAVSAPNLVSWRERAKTIELAGWMGQSTTLQAAGDPVRVPAITATASYFRLLGVQAVEGRVIGEEDDRLDAPPVAMISAGLWRSHFGGSRDVIGRSITVEGQPVTIVGVLPEDFLPTEAQFFTPMRIDLAREDRTNHLVQAIGALRPGASIESAGAELAAIAKQLEAEYPDSNRGWGTTMSSMYDWVVPVNLRRALYIVLGAVACVLLIACANIAGLMLARASGRRREVAVRLAIGAARRRLVRQVLTEGLLLTSVGGAAGILMAFWGLPALRSMLPGSIPRGDEASVNLTVLLFSLGLCAATGLIFSALPAIAGSRAQLVESIKDGARGATQATTRWRQALASAQIALATTLLIAAGVLMGSLQALQRVDLGFDPSQLTTAMMGLPSDRYKGPEANWAFYNRLLERLAAVPGISAAALTSGAPFDGGNTGMPVEAVGPSRLDGKPLQAAWRMVSPHYFSALRIPLVRGEWFSGHTNRDALAMIVSSSMARQIWGTEDVIGRQVAANPAGTFTIVGVVGDVRNLTLAEEPVPTMYISTARFTWPTMTVVVRSDRADLLPVATIRSVVRELDPQLAIFNVQQTTELIGQNAAQARLNAVLLSSFAVVAALLAALGIYGVLAFMVSQARHEIGVRLALGAARRSVVTLFLRRAARLAAAGLAIGLLAAYAAAAAMQSQVYGMSARDPLVFAGAGALVAGVVLLAAILPARRAASVDPLTALRE